MTSNPLEVLASIEWGGLVQVDYEIYESCCPCCNGLGRPGVDGVDPHYLDYYRKTGQHIGHAPGCKLAAALGAGA